MHFHIILIAAVLSALASSAKCQVIHESYKLIPEGARENDAIGDSIHINQGAVIIGSINDDSNGFNSGSAYVFSTKTGVQISELITNFGGARDGIGAAAAIQDNLMIVGVPGHSAQGSGSGSVYVFDMDTNERIAKLLASDGNQNDFFGASLAIDGQFLVVGAYGDRDGVNGSGSAYIFETSTWTEVAKIVPSIDHDTVFFSYSVAIQGDTIAVGSLKTRYQGQSSAGVFLYDAPTGSAIGTLLGDQGTTSSSSSTAIAMDDGILAVTISGDPENALAYTYDLSTQTLLSKIFFNDGSNRQLSSAVGIEDEIVALTFSTQFSPNPFEYLAFLVTAREGTVIAKLEPSDTSPTERFGGKLHMNDGVVAISSRNDDQAAIDAGAVYLFEVNRCPADFSDDGILDLNDAIQFAEVFSLQNPLSDFNFDGQYDFFDISAFLSAFIAGCP
ncbi:MAG: GC-type dockerin domain-anchored protein [Phycisphaerales bacterium]